MASTTLLACMLKLAARAVGAWAQTRIFVGIAHVLGFDETFSLLVIARGRGVVAPALRSVIAPSTPFSGIVAAACTPITRTSVARSSRR